MFPLERAFQKAETSKTEADKAKINEGDEEGGEAGEDEADAAAPLDLDRFAHVWR